MAIGSVRILYWAEPSGSAVYLVLISRFILFVGFRSLALGITFIVCISPLTATLLLFERPKRTGHAELSPLISLNCRK